MSTSASINMHPEFPALPASGLRGRVDLVTALIADCRTRYSYGITQRGNARNCVAIVPRQRGCVPDSQCCAVTLRHRCGHIAKAESSRSRLPRC